MKNVYSYEELYSYGHVPVYGREHTQCAALIGGIGTGSFAIGNRGQLKSWEIFNHPGKDLNFPYTFFAIHGGDDRGCSFTRVLESKLTPPYSNPMGLPAAEASGWPRFSSSKMQGKFPFVSVELEDADVPVRVEMEAYNPFIPLNVDASSIPGGVIAYTVTNISEQELTVSVAGTMVNASCLGEQSNYADFRNLPGRQPFNTLREDKGIIGIYFDSKGWDEADPRYANLSLMTDATEVSYKTEWQMGQRIDGLYNFWNEFDSAGRLTDAPEKMGEKGKFDRDVELHVGSLAVHHVIKPGESKMFRFVISWYVPRRIRRWDGMDGFFGLKEKQDTVRNYYATKFADSWSVGTYLLKERESLEQCTRAFTRAVYASTLPDYVLDAMMANLNILKSTTCFRIENGHFFGYEGSNEYHGSCPGNCTHVWYYAQALAYLFPELERDMRGTEFLRETDEHGAMQFRALTELNDESFGFLPAVDGQMGCILRLYREWLISGDDVFLRTMWPKAILAMDYAIDTWDTDRDYVLDGMMHVDYDVEFYGPNPLGNFCYLAALKASAAIAKHLEDKEHERKYLEIYEKASVRADEIMWNGHYYSQILEDVDKYKYQHGTGCLADQLIGQFYAHLTGLGYLGNEDHIRTAARSIFDYNFVDDFSNVKNMQRVYAVNDERGLCMTTWPFSGQPKQPFFYTAEVWTRTEYHVASTLIWQGEIERGLTIVKAARERYDGIKRNPWNEFESGYHYSGTMSSWGLLPALSGFVPDVPHGKITFEPRINRENFKCFWSTGKAWGTFEQKIENGETRTKVTTLYGDDKDLQVEVR